MSKKKQKLIDVNMVWKLGIFFVSIGVAKLLYSMYLKWRDK